VKDDRPCNAHAPGNDVGKRTPRLRQIRIDLDRLDRPILPAPDSPSRGPAVAMGRVAFRASPKSVYVTNLCRFLFPPVSAGRRLRPHRPLRDEDARTRRGSYGPPIRE